LKIAAHYTFYNLLKLSAFPTQPTMLSDLNFKFECGCTYPQTNGHIHKKYITLILIMLILTKGIIIIMW